MFYKTEQPDRKVSKTNLNYSCCLKFELIEFCKENGLSTQGSKDRLKQRIKSFLDKKMKDEKLTSLKNKRRTIKKII